MSSRALSISDPRFNLREIAKQLILLEQHLLEKGKYCPDCITKHILTVEALADECQSLDKNQDYCLLAFTLGERAKRWGSAFAAGESPRAIGQDVRAWRKKMAQDVLAPLAGGYGALAEEEEESKLVPFVATVLVAGMVGALLWYHDKNTG
jgi:hypothetical protein